MTFPALDFQRSPCLENDITSLGLIRASCVEKDIASLDFICSPCWENIITWIEFLRSPCSENNITSLGDMRSPCLEVIYTGDLWDNPHIKNVIPSQGWNLLGQNIESEENQESSPSVPSTIKHLIITNQRPLHINMRVSLIMWKGRICNKIWINSGHENRLATDH